MKTVSKNILATLIACSLTACHHHDAPKQKVITSDTAITAKATTNKPSDVITPPADPTVKVGILMPYDHKSLQEITAAFTSKLQQLRSNAIEIKVMNAEGDPNLERTLIKKMHEQHFALIVPIATGSAEMTASLVRDLPIVSLGANISEEDRQKNMAIVNDSLSPTKSIELIHAAFPKIKHITLVHSATDTIYHEVKIAIAAGKQNGIEVKPLKIEKLSDLANISMPEKTQAILVLKDNAIVSEINTLSKIATDKHIPLITSDQGSVETVSGFALGVHENHIGEEGAKLAAAVLAADEISAMPIVEMRNDTTVFINPSVLKQQALNVESVEAAAKKLGYNVEDVTKKSNNASFE